jgi:hypothetical protein
MSLFKENDIVVVKAEHANTEVGYHYDYSAWAHTRMVITLVDEGMVTTQAIDQRPDLAWILATRTHDRGNPQNAHMCWKPEQLELAP